MSLSKFLLMLVILSVGGVRAQDRPRRFAFDSGWIGDLVAVQFDRSGRSGSAIDADGRIYRSQDGGGTWRITAVMPETPGPERMESAYFAGPLHQTVWVNREGPVRNSSDGGDSWRQGSFRTYRFRFSDDGVKRVRVQQPHLLRQHRWRGPLD